MTAQDDGRGMREDIRIVARVVIVWDDVGRHAGGLGIDAEEAPRRR